MLIFCSLNLSILSNMYALGGGRGEGGPGGGGLGPIIITKKKTGFGGQ